MSKQNTEASLASLSCNSFPASTEWSAIFAFGVLFIYYYTVKKILSCKIIVLELELILLFSRWKLRWLYTPNANRPTTRLTPGTSMKVRLVRPRCFVLTILPLKNPACFEDGLVCFISLCLLVFVFLNATRRDRNCPTFASKGK